MNLMLPSLVAAAISYAVTPCVMRLAKTCRWVDDPTIRYHPAHTHKGVIPRAGGLALYLGIVIPTLLFSP